MAERNEVSAAAMLDALISSICSSGTMCVLDGSLKEQLYDVVDPDSTVPVSPEELVARVYSPEARRLLDFGCGTGGHRMMLERIGYDWRGLNYREGMAVSVRQEASRVERVDFYDGIAMSCYPDASFDVIYAFQTFEHIQDISKTFSELNRVLSKGGKIVGAVSSLEQMHDYSTFNFTPYGLKLAARMANLRLQRIYPSYDVFTWMLRRLLIVTSGTNVNSLSDFLRRDNNINKALVRFSKANGLDNRDSNLFQLTFSSHITFEISKE